MATFTTPLMNLVLPTVGSEPGPDWASDLNSAFEAVDAHDHTGGNGAQIPSAGLNINSDLGFNGYNATLLRSVRLSSQAASLATANDKNCLSVVSGDLYYNNGSGTAIQLTSGSGLNAASIGGIGGDYGTSSASVSYSDTTKVFSFTQSSGVTAKIGCGDLAIYENVSSANPITIKSPSSLASSYTLTLPPSLPGTGSGFLRVSSAGVMGALVEADGSTVEISGNSLRVKASGITSNELATSAVTPVKVNAPVTISNIASGATFTGSSTSFADITGASATVTTSGKPVMLFVQSASSTNAFLFGLFSGASTIDLQWVRDSTVLGMYHILGTAYSHSLQFIDTSASAGTHTYKLQYRMNSGGSSMYIAYAQIVVREL